MKAMFIRGSLDILLTNEGGVYEGNLIKYFQIIFANAKNLNNPYHNFRHMMHMTWLCYNACIYYSDRMTKREMRNLLIAAMFHDFNHRGTIGEDILNIMLAVQGLIDHILPEDQPYLKEIITLIQATEYPYKTSTEALSLSAQIMRDADLSQSLNSVWLQQVIFGLAAEWKKSPLEVLQCQIAFHDRLQFTTDWAKHTWPEEEIEKKVEEVSRLLEILEQKD